MYRTTQSLVANSSAKRFVGDGMSLTSVLSAAPMVAALILPGSQPNTTTGKTSALALAALAIVGLARGRGAASGRQRRRFVL